MKVLTFLPTFFLLVVTGCQSSEEKMAAQDMCSCFMDYVILIENAPSDSARDADVIAWRDKLDSEEMEVNSCTDALKEKYQELDLEKKEVQQQILAEMGEICPTVLKYAKE